jgi:hypothetical protein
MIEVQSTLDGLSKPKKLDPNMGYMVDFTKLKSVNDLVMVLSAMGISFPGNHPLAEHITPFLNLENPFPLQQPKQPEFIPLKKEGDLSDRIFNKKD